MRRTMVGVQLFAIGGITLLRTADETVEGRGWALACLLTGLTTCGAATALLGRSPTARQLVWWLAPALALAPWLAMTLTEGDEVSADVEALCLVLEGVALVLLLVWLSVLVTLLLRWWSRPASVVRATIGDR